MLERELRLLMEEDAVKSVIAMKQADDRYVIQINGRTLKSARREVRIFARLDTVAELLCKFGIGQFVVVCSGSEAVEGGLASMQPERPG